MKKHSSIAADIVRRLDQGGRITPSIRHHHEWYDITGYPDGLSERSIPLGARIIAVADAYDAMRSPRPCRDALPLEHCIEEIKTYAGTQFDPEWVLAFLELIETGTVA